MPIASIFGPLTRPFRAPEPTAAGVASVPTREDEASPTTVKSGPAIPAGGAQPVQRILVVDDDVNLLRLLGLILRLAGYEVIATEDPILSLDLTAKQKPDLIVLDLQMPKLDGRGVYRELRARGLNVPVMIASAYGARTAQIELGAQASIEKPFDPERLVDAVATLLNGSHSPAPGHTADRAVSPARRDQGETNAHSRSE